MIFSEERLLLQVSRQDSKLTWLVLDISGPLSIDDPLPSNYSWSTDGLYMYYYSKTRWVNLHPGEEVDCIVGEVNFDLQRLDLESGEIMPINTFQPGVTEHDFSISPRADIIAFFDPNRKDSLLTLRDLATGEEMSVRFDIPNNEKWVVGEIVWAPDDNALAFAVVTGSCKSSAGYRTTFILVDLNAGTARTVISEDAKLDWQFEWRDPQFLLLHDKDGTPRRIDVNSGVTAVEEQMPILSSDEGSSLGWLTFIVDHNGYPAVYAVRADGSELTQLSGSLSALFEGLISHEVRFGDWSPDGSWFAFSGTLQGNENDQDIFIARSDGSTRQNLTNSKEFDSQPDWSPDGEQVVFLSLPEGLNSQIDLYAMTVPQANESFKPLFTRLTDTPTYDSDPVWSPDGHRIAFVSARPDNIGTDLYIIGVDGSGFRRLTDDTASKFGLAWSPDGKRIAFIADYEGDPEVYVIDADGTNMDQVTKSIPMAGLNEKSSPTWSPHGGYIAYLSTCDEKKAIYIVRADGTGQWLVTEILAWPNSVYWGFLSGLPEP